MLCPVTSVREDGRDVCGEGARDGEPEDVGFSKDLKLSRTVDDLKLSRVVDLDGQERNLFFWLDMLVASKCSVNTHGCLPNTELLSGYLRRMVIYNVTIILWRFDCSSI